MGAREFADALLKLENWSEVTHGLWRFVTPGGACYEIAAVYQLDGDPPEEAVGALYVSGTFQNAQTGLRYFSRTLLRGNRTVRKLLRWARDDYLYSKEE